MGGFLGGLSASDSFITESFSIQDRATLFGLSKNLNVKNIAEDSVDETNLYYSKQSMN